MITHEGRTYFTKNELGCKHCGMVILAPWFRRWCGYCFCQGLSESGSGELRASRKQGCGVSAG